MGLCGVGRGADSVEACGTCARGGSTSRGLGVSCTEAVAAAFFRLAATFFAGVLRAASFFAAAFFLAGAFFAAAFFTAVFFTAAFFTATFFTAAFFTAAFFTAAFFAATLRAGAFFAVAFFLVAAFFVAAFFVAAFLARAVKSIVLYHCSRFAVDEPCTRGADVADAASVGVI